MKTTVDIAARILEAAKARAAKEGRPLREVMEEALREYLQVGRPERRPFRLRAATFRGRGLQPGIAEGRWEEIRSLIYPT